MITIYTNHHWRQFQYFYELTDKEKEDLDWIEDDLAAVFRYRGEVYSLDDFMTLERLPGEPEEFKYWDGYRSDSAFSGILIKLHPEDSDYYQVATYIA